MAKAWQLSSDRALTLGSLPAEVLAQESWWLASWPIVAEKRVDDRWLCCASTLWRWGSTEARWLDSLLCRRDLSASCVFSTMSQCMCLCRILYPKTLNIQAGCQWWRWSLWCQWMTRLSCIFNIPSAVREPKIARTKRSGVPTKGIDFGSQLEFFYDCKYDAIMPWEWSVRRFMPGNRSTMSLFLGLFLCPSFKMHLLTDWEWVVWRIGTYSSRCILGSQWQIKLPDSV